MNKVRTLTCRDAAAWRAVVEQSAQYDFYHLPEYHALAEARGEGEAHLFVYEEDAALVALPLLLRPLDDVAGLGGAGQGWRDATSVYGYAGPVTNLTAGTLATAAGFRHALAEWLTARGVVALFTRLHPLLPQAGLLSGLGERLLAGHTVSIDLTLAPEEQVARYRKGHRYEIRRAERMGMTCVLDKDAADLLRFAELYRTAMLRLNAAAYYHFDDAYFEQLYSSGLGMQLLLAYHEGALAAGALFARCGPIVQYHLAATNDACSRLAPMKLIVDTARRWAVEQGATVLHLGGGAGAAKDSLYDFKAGFGGPTHEFALWRWLVNPQACVRLNAIAAEHDRRHGLRPANETFFPLYRAPRVPTNSANDLHASRH